jgi:hypothetical protein
LTCGIGLTRFERLISTIQGPADGWQKDEWGRTPKVFGADFSAPSYFRLRPVPDFSFMLFPSQHGLYRQFIKRNIQLTYHIVNGFLQEFLKKL